MSSELIGWYDEHALDHRRRLRNSMLVSLAVHGLVFAAFAVSPPRKMAPMPQVLAVDLIAALPGPPAPAPASAPAPRPKPRPAPAPEAPPAPPPPPVVKAPVQVLPEETPGRIREAKPEPKVVAKLKPEPKPAPPRPRREKALSYEDAMAALDDELGVDETADLLTPAPVPSDNEDSSAEPQPSATQRPGAVVSPELAAWNLKTLRLIQSKWVTPPNFLGRGLETGLELRLSASGAVVGVPRVAQSSGDPFFDDNVVRAVLTVAPLPPPPEPGRRIFIFKAEAN